MIKLRISQGDNFLEADSDIPPGDLGLVTYIQLKGHGVGIKNASIGSTAPNRAMIDMGTTDKGLARYRNVVLPDNYDFTKVTEVMLYDSKQGEDPLTFEPDKATKFRFLANQEQRKKEATRSSDRQYAVITKFKHQFELIGDVGVNDLGPKMIVTIEVPRELTQEEANQILDFAEAMGQEMAVNLEMEVKVLAGHASIRREAPGYLRGHLGESRMPEVALAGRQPVELEGIPQGTNNADLNKIGPWSDDKGKQEGDPNLGVPTQDYGADPGRHDP